MSIEAIILAVANAARPTGLAVTYALLSAPRPRRVLTAYIVFGFTWSCLIGFAIVEGLHGVEIQTDRGTVEAIIEVLLGVAALGFAGGFATARLEFGQRQREADQSSRIATTLRNPSLRVAATTGILTHLPGLMYLLGLNVIAGRDPNLIDGALNVVVFNAIWFLPPIVSLVMSIRRTEETREALGRFNRWVQRYRSEFVAALFAATGVYFTVKGVLALAG
jgi:Sap, sulfolipid-1-addressing protein